MFELDCVEGHSAFTWKYYKS